MKRKLVIAFALLLFSASAEAQLKNKLFYSGSIVLTFTHGGMVDALVWEPEKESLPAFVRNDFTYLGGSLIALSTNLYTANKWRPSGKLDFWFTTIGSSLIGSVFWDMTFSELRYDDPFYPVPNWYGGFGFSRKEDRIAFDVSRLTVGLALLVFSELL